MNIFDTVTSVVDAIVGHVLVKLKVGVVIPALILLLYLESSHAVRVFIATDHADIDLCFLVGGGFGGVDAVHVFAFYFV
jgi:hypothetical protein